MVRCAVTLLTVLSLSITPRPGCAETPGGPRLAILVDASASMGLPLPDRADRFGAAREALAALALALPETSEGLRISVWLYGAETDLVDPAACRDVTLAGRFGVADRRALRRALDAADPGGAAPLAFALERVADDLGEIRPDDLVVVLTDGADSCGGDLAAAAERFVDPEGASRLRLLGITTPSDTTGLFLGLAPTRRPTATADLTQHLLGFSESVVALRTTPVSARLAVADPAGRASFAQMTITGSTSPDPLVLDFSRPGVPNAGPELPPGEYSLAIEFTDGETAQALRVPVSAEDAGSLTPPVPGSAEVEVSVVEADGVHPQRIQVDWTGAPGDEPLVLRTAFEDAPGASWIDNAPVAGTDGTLLMPTPDRFGAVVVRLLAPTDTAEWILAEATVSIPGPRLELEAPETYRPGTPIPVSWSWSLDPGDMVTVVPEGSEPERLGGWSWASAFDPVDLPTPDSACPLEVRYLSARTRRPLATAIVQPDRQLAGLLSPKRAQPGQNLTVHWWGPGGGDDALTIAAADMPESDYLEWSDTSTSSPATIRAPRRTGDYEIRYVSPTQGVLARRPLEVIEIPRTLSAPDACEVGSRIEVSWTAPPGANDFITIAPAGSPVGHMVDFVYVSVGSPASLAAPFEPGDFVIRYVDGDSREVIVERPVTVEP